MGHKVCEQYLTHYAEPEARVLWTAPAHLISASWEQVLVVPVLGESPTFISAWHAALAREAGRVLWILVVNATPVATPDDLSANQQLLADLRARAGTWQRLPGEVPMSLALLPCESLRQDQQARASTRHMPGVHVLVVERTVAPFLLSERCAVGQARKLGNDVALALFLRGALRSPWFYQSDADATPPLDLFTRDLGEGQGARIFPFRHTLPEGADTPSARSVLRHTLHYEVWLRYHVLSMRAAGSPYAFHALGSCLVVHASSYAQVRGFPKRAAGEDYHLLQKLTKLGPVQQLSGAPVRIAARHSHRTPFGTGRAVQQLADTGQLGFDAPESYLLLARWLQRLQRYATERDVRPLELTASAEQDAVEQVLRSQLQAMGAEQRLRQLLSECPSGADLLPRAHTWFDGIKSLRLLHSFRSLYPPLPAAAALGRSWLGPCLGLKAPLGGDLAAWQLASERLAQLEALPLEQLEGLQVDSNAPEIGHA